MNLPLEAIPISALQHWSYCPRQWALIHQEQVFTENIHTMRGQAVHSRVDMSGFENRPGLRIERALPLWCDRLGLVGKADIVEFSGDGTPYPVEYKHGRMSKNPMKRHHDELQLTAQALCLEEMLSIPVREGAVYQASSKKRRIVLITDTLREEVTATVDAIRQMLASGIMPPPTSAVERCQECSLIDDCQPDALRILTAIDTRQLFDPEN
jgi:CRISPR-associated exonuclease Cas4